MKKSTPDKIFKAMKKICYLIVSDTPIISVIIPTYNQSEFLGRCLRSILNQIIPKEEYEIIVINDGSNDQTSKVLKIYENQISIIENKNNKGLPYSINKGIKSAKGRFIVRVRLR